MLGVIQPTGRVVLMPECPHCSRRPLNELIDLQGRLHVCESCLGRFQRLRDVYQQLIDSGLSEKLADQLMCEMVNNERS